MKASVEDILAKYWYDTQYNLIDKQNHIAAEESRKNFNKWIEDNTISINSISEMNSKETLETAAENQCEIEGWGKYDSTSELFAIKNSFIAGAKWQQERMYSENEVNEIISETWLSCEDNEGNETFTQSRKRILDTYKKKT